MEERIAALLMLVKAFCPAWTPEPPPIEILSENAYVWMMEQMFPGIDHYQRTLGYTLVLAPDSPPVAIILRDRSQYMERVLCHELTHWDGERVVPHEHFPGTRKRERYATAER